MHNGVYTLTQNQILFVVFTIGQFLYKCCRATAEAAKARLMYADEEERIKVEKAKLEAKIDKMVLERETAAAVA